MEQFQDTQGRRDMERDMEQRTRTLQNVTPGRAGDAKDPRNGGPAGGMDALAGILEEIGEFIMGRGETPEAMKARQSFGAFLEAMQELEADENPEDPDGGKFRTRARQLGESGNSGMSGQIQVGGKDFRTPGGGRVTQAPVVF